MSAGPAQESEPPMAAVRRCQPHGDARAAVVP